MLDEALAVEWVRIPFVESLSGPGLVLAVDAGGGGGGEAATE